MVNIKTLMLALATQASALEFDSSSADTTVVTTEETFSSSGFTLPTFPEGAIDISNNRTLVNQLKREHGLPIYDEEVIVPTDDQLSARGGACNQGKCPDYNKGFDMMYTWTMINQPGSGGAPPAPLVWNDFDIRVNDCGKCYRHRVGSTHGGCYKFTACGRPQTICVDSGKDRAHRVWRDKNVKKCYKMQEIGLGGCGPVQARVIWKPERQVACNW